MPKNNLNSWVGTTMQPQFQTYQTAGMLQPQTGQTGQPLGPPPPVTPSPPPPSTQGTVITPPPTSVPTFPLPVQDQGAGTSPTAPMPTQPTQPAPAPLSTGSNDRDRLIESIMRSNAIVEF